MVRVQSVAARNACNKRALANIIGERDGVIIRKANQADFTDEAWREVQIVKFCKEVSIMDKKTFKRKRTERELRIFTPILYRVTFARFTITQNSFIGNTP